MQAKGARRGKARIWWCSDCWRSAEKHHRSKELGPNCGELTGIGGRSRGEAVDGPIPHQVSGGVLLFPDRARARPAARRRPGRCRAPEPGHAGPACAPARWGKGARREKNALNSKAFVRTRALPERWPSGRRRSPAKGVGGQPSRGFESLPLRHFLLYHADLSRFFRISSLLKMRAGGLWKTQGSSERRNAARDEQVAHCIDDVACVQLSADTERHAFLAILVDGLGPAGPLSVFGSSTRKSHDRTRLRSSGQSLMQEPSFSQSHPLFGGLSAMWSRVCPA